ncbi:uncharacterized protein IAS62_004167 [Cryptococcus decagattii]|uniref:Antiphagocytic protein 1 n=1 Tax=Cryptococcus decagattii TaxID=1859122 RepID=A0ABZ2AWM5_9TREE
MMSSAPSELCFDCANCVEMLPKGTKKSVIRPEILERLTRIEDRIEVQTTLLRGMAANGDYEKKVYTDDDDELEESEVPVCNITREMAALKTYKPQPKVTNHKIVIEAALGRLDHVNGDNSIRWAQSVILGLQAAEALQNDRQMMELARVIGCLEACELRWAGDWRAGVASITLKELRTLLI